MTESNDAPELPAARTRALIEAQMPQRSLAALEREIGLENLGRRLNQAAAGHYIPLDTIVAVHNATGITIQQLLVTMFEDAGMPEYLPFPDVEPETVRLAIDVANAKPEQRDLLGATVRWMQTLKSD